jgi:hypothetical protein
MLEPGGSICTPPPPTGASLRRGGASARSIDALRATDTRFWGSGMLLGPRPSPGRAAPRSWASGLS